MKPRLIAAVVLAGASAFAAEPNPLGVQLWSLRNQLQDRVPAGMDLVRSMGFTVVESAGTYGLSAQQFRALADAHGLKIVSGHFPYERLLGDLPGVIAEAKALGMAYVIAPWIPHEGDFAAAQAHEVAANFNKIGAATRAAGLGFGFHTHGYEFKPLPDGSTAYDILLKETKPDLVFVEMDVFWVVSGGQDPVTLLRRYPGRCRMFHVRDMRKGAVTGVSTGRAPTEDNVAVGRGQMDWPAILAAGEKAGVVYSFIEDATSDPVGNIPASVLYMKTLGLNP
ncbi:MAG TPA: sugar phosphate isomerase/epimerase [Opitutaceae bacterium]|nr:sugar phosphate isomerase/epimerase [Opitutaceae bacterium]